MTTAKERWNVIAVSHDESKENYDISKLKSESDQESHSNLMADTTNKFSSNNANREKVIIYYLNFIQTTNLVKINFESKEVNFKSNSTL